MAKPLPNASITGPVEFYDYIAIVEPLFWLVMLGAFWIIMFVNFIRFGASRAWITASLIALVPAIFVAILGWMDPKWIYLFGVFLAIGLFWRSLESGAGQ